MTPSDSIKDSTRVVVQELHHGGILPANRAEMWRDIYFLPGCDIQGPVWGNRIVAQGPDVRVADAVYVRGEVRVSAAAADALKLGSVVFGSAVTTPDSIVVEDAGFRTRFLSNVYAGAVNLRNTVVHGNVYARSGIIRDSVILGGVFCREGLTLENCIVASFRAKMVTVGEGVSMLFPVGMAEQSITLRSPVRILLFASLGEDQPTVPQGVVSLDESDIYRVRLPDGSVRENPDGTSAQGDILMLSLNERVLDTAGLRDTFAKNRRALEILALTEHLCGPKKLQARKGLTLELEERLMAMIKRDDMPRAEARTTIGDLLRRADVAEAMASFGFRDNLEQVAARVEAESEWFDGSHELPPELEELFKYEDGTKA